MVSNEAGVEDGPPLGRQTALAESLQRPPNVELNLERRWIEDHVGRRIVRELYLQAAAAGVVDGLVARHHPQPGMERPPGEGLPQRRIAEQPEEHLVHQCLPICSILDYATHGMRNCAEVVHVAAFQAGALSGVERAQPGVGAHHI